jgi:hypothetical protein
VKMVVTIVVTANMYIDSTCMLHVCMRDIASAYTCEYNLARRSIQIFDMVTSYYEGLTTVSMGRKSRLPRSTLFCSGCCGNESASILSKNSNKRTCILLKWLANESYLNNLLSSICCKSASIAGSLVIITVYV